MQSICTEYSSDVCIINTHLLFIQLAEKYQHKKEGYLHGVGEELLPQRWFSLGQEVEIHPSQSRCHSGSMGGSGPVTHKTNKWVLVFFSSSLLRDYQ